MQAEAQAKAEAAAGEGRAYLAENAKREGVTVLPSGLQFEVLSTGEGAKPSREDTVRTHYHGTLIDGTVFDSSYQRGQPAEFPVGGVIAGWVEALQLMNAGSKWRLHVPSELAYGGQAVGQHSPAQRAGVRRRTAGNPLRRIGPRKERNAPSTHRRRFSLRHQ